MTDLVTIAFDSINHYLVACRGGWLLVDPGWAGTLARASAELKRHDIQPSAIRYVMITHHHPDHAGLTQEVKREWGARLVIHDRQVLYLPALQAFYERKRGYEPIVVDKDDIVVGPEGSRSALRAIGIAGEIIETPGHSEDSVSLALDSGNAIIGDLHLPGQVTESMAASVAASWRKLISAGVQTAYPAHTGPIRIKDVAILLGGRSSI